jgi:hypothetical protein
MRDTFYKFMPIGFGLLLGWVLFNPPAWLQTLGPLAWVVHAGLCAMAVLGVIALVIVANLPADLHLETVSEASVPADVRGLARRLETLDFDPAGPPRRAHIAPPALILGFVHRSEPIYATVYRTETVPPKTSYDFVSMLEGDRGGLTTNADPAGAVLPAGSESLRQVFPGESIEALFRKHREGMAFLRERGIACRPVSAGTFPDDLVRAIARQRRLFLAAPLRGALVTLWRAASKQVPFRGGLRGQKIASQQIARLIAG